MMSAVQCVICQVSACTDEISKTPAFCPRRNAAEAVAKGEEIRATDGEVQKIAEVAQSVGTEGYRQWPRVRELIEFARRMGIRKLGVAFCVGLKEETAQLAKILKSHGFDLSTVACTVNGGCNPVGQALVLNQQETELNIIMGLCMGHDVLFSQFSEAPVTTLVVKDRAMCHNPAAPLVNRYWRDTFLKGE
jgi:uncharacterized metal-binding protein